MFFKGLKGYLPANILQGVIGFGSLILLTRMLSPQEYGIYALAFGVTSLIHTAVFTWLEASMARFYPAESLKDPCAPGLYGTIYRLFGALVAGYIFISLLGLRLWGLWLSGLWVWQGQDALILALSLGLFSAIFRSLLKLVQEQRRSQGRVAIAAQIDMAQTSLGFLMTMVCVKMGLGGAAPLLGAGLAAFICLPFVVGKDMALASAGTFDPQKAKSYAQYGMPIAVSLILTLGLATVDRFFIAYYLGTEDAGAYHAGYSLASRLLDVIFLWFAAAGSPALVRALESGGVVALQKQAGLQITTMALVLFPAVGGLIMTAPALSTIMIGEALRDKALLVTPMIALGALFSGFNSYYFLQAFTLAKKTRWLSLAIAVPFVANIGLNFALIPMFGLYGAGLAMVLSFALGSLAAILLGQKALPLPFPAWTLAKITACVFVMMGALSLMPPLAVVWLDLMVRTGLGVIIYAVMLASLNINDCRHQASRLFAGFSARVKS
jgi:O-antigen/teichoic acid export membrane protein